MNPFDFTSQISALPSLGIRLFAAAWLAVVVAALIAVHLP